MLYKGLVYNPYSRTDMDKGEWPKNLFDSTETVWNNMEKDHAILSPLLNSLTTYLFFGSTKFCVGKISGFLIHKYCNLFLQLLYSFYSRGG